MPRQEHPHPITIQNELRSLREKTETLEGSRRASTRFAILSGIAFATAVGAKIIDNKLAMSIEEQETVITGVFSLGGAIVGLVGRSAGGMYLEEAMEDIAANKKTLDDLSFQQHPTSKNP